MANKKTKGFVKKSKLQPATKSKLLESYCDNEQLAIIRDLVSKGSAFIILGSEYAPVREFQKGLMQEMYSPTSNGVAIYDTHYRFKYNNERDVITISLNDTSNTHINFVDSIKRLDTYRSKTLYTYHYTGGNENG